MSTNTKDNTAEKVFQVYKSSMQAHKMVMPKGRVIHIINFQYVTANMKEIAFLDEEIEEGFPYLRKLEPVTSAELDPMATLRAKIREEARVERIAEQEALAAKQTLEDSQSEPTKLNIASSADLAGKVKSSSKPS